MAKSKKTSPIREQKQANWFSSLSPTKQDLLSIGFLYLITLVVFRGIVFNDGAFSTSGDTANAVTLAKVGNDIKEREGVDVLWMPQFFSGMPTFGNVHYLPHDVSYAQKIVVTVLDLLYLNRKWSWFAVYYLFCGVFTFLLLRVWKLSRPAALLGAITFMLSPYGIGLAAEGHGSKLMALSYLPVTFLLTHVLFEKRNLLSFGLLSVALGTLLLTNHMQIVYYVLMVLGLYLLYHIIRDFKENKKLIPAKTALFAGAVVIGLCISSYIYLSVYEYSQFSIRGGGTVGAKGGLTWDYATNWSFHPMELLTLIIPSFFGFSSQYPYMWQGQNQMLPLYWGTMPFNTSTVYFGVVPLLLGVLALIYKRNAKTIFFAILGAAVLLMSFGKHFGIFYEVLFNTLPFFNKFRAPAMILHLLAFVFAVLGAFGLDFLLDHVTKEVNTAKLKKALLYTLGAFGVILLLGFIMKSSLVELFGFTFKAETESYEPKAAQILKDIRWELLWKDYIKFIAIIGAAIGAIILYLNKTIKAGTFGGLMIAILLADLFVIDARFIDPKPQTQLEENLQSNATTEFLKQQPGLFRIFPLGELFQYETSFQYQGLQSLGGYSPAKLKIYQTMLDSCMYHSSDASFPINMNMVNMLNAKYIVANGQLPPDRFKHVFTDEAKRILTYENPGALPRAFFVKNAVVAENDHQTFGLLNAPDFNPAVTAVVEKPLAQQVAPAESSASATVANYQSREIAIKTNNTAQSLLVLSEIYYPAGWNAYVDGTPTEIYRTNYILRSVVVPAGAHTVEFKFEPKMYELGWTLSNAAWGVALLCILIGLWQTPTVRARLGRTAAPIQQNL
ncbi:MAG: YfhO family protein [Ignavibacteriae bacterium]|nr:YfhO family protein [Ignavibacteriota bacterium]